MSEQLPVPQQASTSPASFRDRAPVVLQEFGMTLLELSGMAAKAGFFGKALTAEQALMKIIVGRELGMNPMQSLMNVDFFDGNLSIRANWRATIMKGVNGGHQYDYRVVEHTGEKCVIEVFRDGEQIGISSYALADAQKAGLAGKDNWRKSPLNMLFARAITNAQRWYAPELMGGMPVYDPDEIGEIAKPSHAATMGAAALAAQIKATAQQLDQMEEQKKTVVVTQPDGVQVNTTTGEVIEVEVNGEASTMPVTMVTPEAMSAEQWEMINRRAQAIMRNPDDADEEAQLCFDCCFNDVQKQSFSAASEWLDKLEPLYATPAGAVSVDIDPTDIVDPFAE